MINFPKNPVQGQKYSAGIKTWTFNGRAWELQSVSDSYLQRTETAMAAAQAAAIEAANQLTRLRVADYAGLRALTADVTAVYVSGYLVTAAPAGIAGVFVRDDTDVASADNGGTIIVATNGKRWKRQYSGGLSPAWFGAKGNGVDDDANPILAAKLYCETTGKTLKFPDGVFVCSKDIIINASTSIHGAGQAATTIKMTGTAHMVSNRNGVTDYADLRDFKLLQGGTATVGLDIGTLRRSLVRDVYVQGFNIGVSLDMGVSGVANYWNRLFNVTAECTGQTAPGSVGFLFGNNVQVTYPDTDYNELIGCKSFVCETAIRMVNAIGCHVTQHQATVCTNGLIMDSGNNNTVQMVCENVTNMGSAAAATRANKLELYNDGGNATAFVDNGWNYMGSQVLDFPSFSSPMKAGDAFIKDRIFYSGTAAAVPLFKLTMDGNEGVATVALAYAGYIAGKLEIAGVAVWDVFKVGAGSTPKAVLSRMTGATSGTASFSGTTMVVQSGTYATGQTITGAGIPVGTVISATQFGGGGVGTNFTISNDVGTLNTRPVSAANTILSVSAAADGTLTWAATGDAAALMVLNTVVDIQGISGLQVYPYSRVMGYKRLV